MWFIFDKSKRIKKVRGGQPPRVARENGRVKIQVLHIEDCPNWQEAGDRVRLVLDSIGRGDVPVEFVFDPHRG